MKKRFFAVISALAIFISFLPNVFADTYNNSAFVGKYLSAGATNSNYGELNILSCDSNAVTVDFKFVKNGNQQLIYTCYEGKMNDTTGTVPFTVNYASNGQFVANGTMKITLTDWCVNISCDSDKQHLFDGTMKPTFTLNPHGNTVTTPTQSPSQTVDIPNLPANSDISVVLNGKSIPFSNGVKPVIINDSTYVPLRSIFDKMGINVYWDQFTMNTLLDAQTITCTKNNIIVQFMRTFNEYGSNVWTLSKWVDSDTSSNNYTRINITDLQPTIIGDTSYIPLRVVSEAFGAEVGWLHDERIVDIVCDTSNEYKYSAELIANIEDFNQSMATSYISEDFKYVKANPVPYFTAQSKFYKYTAEDQWNDVELHVFYAGFIDVLPIVYDDTTREANVETDETQAPVELVSTETPNEETEQDSDVTLIEETPSQEPPTENVDEK